MGKSNYNLDTSNAPKTLEDHLFYGLNLDEEQKIFRDAIWNPETIVTLCNAKAGCGKSTIALGVANLLVQYGLYNEIVYIISPTAEQRQGYIPGGPEEKNAPYMQPLIDACSTLNLNPDQVIKGDNMQAIKEGKAYISFLSDTYLRGTNFENKVIIIDECQNYYYDLLKKTLTRIHDNCKVVVIGHTGQCDLYKNREKSGFKIYLEAFEKIKDDPRVKICHLTKNYRGWFSDFCDNVEY